MLISKSRGFKKLALSSKILFSKISLCFWTVTFLRLVIVDAKLR